MSQTLNPGSDDCYFYYYSSCTKGDGCMFRHCEAALGNEAVCMSWKDGQCTEADCMFRHMEIKHDRSTILCYWEGQPGGCRKPHCVFRHTRPRDEGGTMLSEEEKLAAITSPPPQMAMPMAEDPPDLYNVPVLPQDRAADSPTVERVVINPFEEETDEESVHGTPVKSSHVTRVEQLRMQGKPNIAKKTEKENTNGQEELNFSVKSLEEIREEKLARAKRLIEEADNLLSKEDPELMNKVEDVKKKLTEPPMQVNRGSESRLTRNDRESDSRLTRDDDRESESRLNRHRDDRGYESRLTTRDSRDRGSESRLDRYRDERRSDSRYHTDDRGSDSRLNRYRDDIDTDSRLNRNDRGSDSRLARDSRGMESRLNRPRDDRPTERLKEVGTGNKVVKISLKKEEEQKEDLGLKSYEEILREKALASMMRAKSKRLDDDKKKTEPPQEETVKEEEERDDGKRRVVVRRLSDESQEGGRNQQRLSNVVKTTIHNRLGDKIGIKGRVEAKASGQKVAQVSSVKSRLGIAKTEARKPSPVPQDTDSDTETVIKQPRVLSSIRNRIGVKKVEIARKPSPGQKQNSDNESETVRGKPKVVNSIKSRLGIQRAKLTKETSPVPSEEQSESESENETVARQPKTVSSSLRNRLGVQREDKKVKKVSSLTTITMSDFSSDGLTESESETEKVKKTRIKSRVAENVKREEKVKLKRNPEVAIDDLGIESLEKLLREKKMKLAQQQQQDSEEEGESGGHVTGSEDEEDEDIEPVVEVKPRKIQLGGKRKVTVPEDEDSSPPKMRVVKAISPVVPTGGIVRRRRVVKVCNDDEDDSTEVKQGSSQAEVKQGSRRVVGKRVDVVVKATAGGGPIRLRTGREKGERRVPRMELYRPPALMGTEMEQPPSPVKKKSVLSSRVKPSLVQEEEVESDEQPVVKRKNKNWGVKTFSEILKEKQLKREQKTSLKSSGGKPSLEPLSCDQTIAEDERITSKKKKALFSPIKFGTDDIDGNAKEVVFKVRGLTKKRSLSPEIEEDIASKKDAKVPEDSSHTQVASKKTKRSSVWSTRSGNLDRTKVQGQGDRSSVQGQTEVITVGRKLNIQRRLGKVASNSDEDITRTERLMSSVAKVMDPKKPSMDSTKEKKLLFGKPVANVSGNEEKVLFGKKSIVVEEKDRVQVTKSVGKEEKLLFGKPRLEKAVEAETSGYKKTEIRESVKAELPVTSIKSPLSRVYTNPLKKQATPKVATPTNRRRSSSTKDSIKSTAGTDSDFLFTENDESLNLEDTLDEELVQLLGEDSTVTSSNSMEVDPDEDLLKEMEELLG